MTGPARSPLQGSHDEDSAQCVSSEGGVQFLLQSAEAGHPAAQQALFRIYEEGSGAILPDTLQAQRWAAECGSQASPSALRQRAQAELELGAALPSAAATTTGWQLMEKAAKAGHSLAQYSMGKHAAQQGDHESGARWMRQAADSGHSGAKAHLTARTSTCIGS